MVIKNNIPESLRADIRYQAQAFMIQHQISECWQASGTLFKSLENAMAWGGSLVHHKLSAGIRKS